eukprot:362969-Chlamydomonas_euryale.AAC.7
MKQTAQPDSSGDGRSGGRPGSGVTCKGMRRCCRDIVSRSRQQSRRRAGDGVAGLKTVGLLHHPSRGSRKEGGAWRATLSQGKAFGERPPEGHAGRLSDNPYRCWLRFVHS